NESPLWTNAENLGAICLDCVNEARDSLKNEQEEEYDDKQDGEQKSSKKKTRLTRSYKTRLNPFAIPKLGTSKGKGRRSMFKKAPIKAPDSVATPITGQSVFYKGSYFQVGDIVSMIDEEFNLYYAQLRGFLVDQYCEKSAVVTWLLPTKESPPPEEGFDPATYVIGPDEELPRKLECMEFIMHAPSDYYKAKNTPYPPIEAPAEPGYIWTSLHSIHK
ncbi:GATA zinc finger domain-containing protein 1-like, partial [Agrilus planipennis]